MALFEFNNQQSITSFPDLLTLSQTMKRGESGSANAIAESAANDSLNLDKQFVIFQLGQKKDGPALLETSQVEPVIAGSEQEPDVIASLEMLSFNIGASATIDVNARATMRINIGKDENSRDKYFDTAFWSIAAGLNLYDQANGKPTKAKELNASFKKAFGNKPIEIAGGLSKMTFEVVKHEEPKWWQRVFDFLNSTTGKSLVSTVGFPAITTPAIHMLDELLNRLDQHNPEILFKSLPLRLALSKQAKTDFTAGNERIAMGSLNPGICVLAKGEDYGKILDANAIYYPAFDKLVPGGVTERDLLSNHYDDPFKDITFAVFRLGMKQTKLEPSFNFGN